MKGRVLVAGFATRHVAQSAFRAGYEVYAVDHFCDQDLAWYTKDRLKFEDLQDLPDAVDRISRMYSFDMLVVTSGAEDLPTTLPICGTPREKITRFLDKMEMQQFFETIPVPVPRLLNDGEYPAMVKPLRGAGGWRNTIIHNADELVAWEDLYPGVPFIRQELIEGLPASVCCVTNGKGGARAIAANEQILRGEGEASFGFSGSVTPLESPSAGHMIRIAETIAAESGCSGTIGIDFVVRNNAPYAIEINPRFQGTVDTVETATGINLFQAHADACTGILPGSTPRPQKYAARRILFADRDMALTTDLITLAPIISDIPWPGTFFEKGQAIVSVSGEGATRVSALAVLDKHISTVRQYIR